MTTHGQTVAIRCRRRSRDYLRVWLVVGTLPEAHSMELARTMLELLTEKYPAHEFAISHGGTEVT